MSKSISKFKQIKIAVRRIKKKKQSNVTKNQNSRLLQILKIDIF